MVSHLVLPTATRMATADGQQHHVGCMPPPCLGTYRKWALLMGQGARASAGFVLSNLIAFKCESFAFNKNNPKGAEKLSMVSIFGPCAVNLPVGSRKGGTPHQATMRPVVRFSGMRVVVALLAACAACGRFWRSSNFG